MGCPARRRQWAAPASAQARPHSAQFPLVGKARAPSASLRQPSSRVGVKARALSASRRSSHDDDGGRRVRPRHDAASRKAMERERKESSSFSMCAWRRRGNRSGATAAAAAKATGARTAGAAAAAAPTPRAKPATPICSRRKGSSAQRKPQTAFLSASLDALERL